MKGSYRERSKEGGGRSTQESPHKLAYAITGVASLVLFFTLGYGFFSGSVTARFPPAMIAVLGIVFYVFFFLWLFLLAKIVYPPVAFRLALGLEVVYFEIDTLFPPWFITKNGEILTSGANGSFGASDVVVGSLLSELGVHGPWLFFSVYVIIPSLVLFVLVPAFWASRKIGAALTR